MEKSPGVIEVMRLHKHFNEGKHMNAEFKFMLSLGLLIRGTVITQIKDWCFSKDLKITIEEDKGWLDSTYRIMVEGEASKVLEFKDTLNEFVSRFA